MYQMGPKSPSVNGSGKPQVVSDAQAREKLAVSFQKNPKNDMIMFVVGIRI